MPPLELDLKVEERTPTEEEFRELLPLADPPQPATFLLDTKTGGASTHPTSSKDLHELANNDPSVLNWPIFVNWTDFKLSIGNPKPVSGRTIDNTLRSVKRPAKKDFTKTEKAKKEERRQQQKVRKGCLIHVPHSLTTPLVIGKACNQKSAKATILVGAECHFSAVTVRDMAALRVPAMVG